VGSEKFLFAASSYGSIWVYNCTSDVVQDWTVAVKLSHDHRLYDVETATIVDTVFLVSVSHQGCCPVWSLPELAGTDCVAKTASSGSLEVSDIQPVQTLHQDVDVATMCDCAFNDSGTFLAVAGKRVQTNTGMMLLHSVPGFQQLQCADLETPGTCVTFSGEAVLVGLQDGRVELFCVEEGGLHHSRRLSDGVGRPVECLVSSANGVAATFDSGVLHFFTHRKETGKPDTWTSQSLQFGQNVCSAAMSDRHNSMVVVSNTRLRGYLYSHPILSPKALANGWH